MIAGTLLVAHPSTGIKTVAELIKVAKEKPPPVDKPVQSKKAAQEDFNALLNKLTTPDKPVKNAKAGPRAIQGIGAANAMTADLADALKSQIFKCWSPPVGALSTKSQERRQRDR